MTTPRSQEIRKVLEGLFDAGRDKWTGKIFHVDKALSAIESLMPKEIEEGEVLKILHTTKLGTGYSFLYDKNYDLFLQDWKVKMKEMKILAKAIASHFSGAKDETKS